MQKPKPKRIDPAPAAEIANDDQDEAADDEQHYGEMQDEDSVSEQPK